MEEEGNEPDLQGVQGRRVFGVVLRGYPEDFQAWLNSAKTYGLYVVFSKSTRTGKLILKEDVW
jgi:hypothetical protein